MTNYNQLRPNDQYRHERLAQESSCMTDEDQWFSACDFKLEKVE